MKFKLVNFEKMTTEINGYGYEYSIKKFTVQLLMAYFFIILASLYFKLNMVCIFLLCAWIFVCLPIIILAQFRYLANNKKFETLVGYLEQMIFAFKKSPKILESLKNVSEIVDDDLKETVNKAILAIENDTEGDGYKKAFALIEKEYPCTRIKALHKFMISVEENGGKYQRSIDVLLDDIRTWVTRAYEYQKELKSIKSKIILSIGLSLCIAGTMSVMVPADLIDFSKSIVYQVSTTILFIVLIGLLAYLQTRLNGKWFVDDTLGTDEKLIKVFMDRLDTHDEKADRKKSIIKFCISLPILLAGALFNSVPIIVLGLAFSIFCLFEKKLKHNSARKRIVRELEKEFPLWLRDIALQLQTLVVPLAIQNSIKESPLVLKPHLNQLVEEINRNPTSIIPYNDFLKKYRLADVTNAMRILYTIQTLDVEDAQEQITDLVKRNQKMLAKSERIRNEDILTGIGFIVALPMIIATLKLVVDLMLVMAAFFSMSSGMM